MSQNSLLPIEAITGELLSAYAQSERDKHSECVGHCKHLAETKEIGRVLKEAFASCPMMQSRIDRQLALTLEHGHRNNDLENALRTFAVTMIENGWELARFALEGKEMDGLIQ